MIALRKDAVLSFRIQLYHVVYVHLTSIEKQRDHDIRKKHENRDQKTSITTGRFGQPFLFSRVYFFSFYDQRFLFPSTCLFVPSFLVVFWSYATQFFIDARFWSRFFLHEFSVFGQKKTNVPDIDSQATISSICSMFVRIFSFLFFFWFFFSFYFWDKDHIGLMYILKYIYIR